VAKVAPQAVVVVAGLAAEVAEASEVVHAMAVEEDSEVHHAEVHAEGLAEDLETVAVEVDLVEAVEVPQEVALQVVVVVAGLAEESVAPSEHQQLEPVELDMPDKSHMMMGSKDANTRV